MLIKDPNIKENLPNLELIRNLHEVYYGNQYFVDAQESSHWREYSETLTFKLDSEGFPAEVSGYGFGDFERRSKRLSFFKVLLAKGVVVPFCDFGFDKRGTDRFGEVTE